MIAYVATLRLGSVMRVSKSILHVATLVGWVKASAASVLVAANFRTGFGVVKKTCKTTPNPQDMYPLSIIQKRLTSNRFCELSSSDVFHFTYSARRFEVDHIAFMTQPTFKQFKDLSLDTGRLI